MHRRLLGGILGAAMPFFDVEPSGRILNRFIKDLARVDETVSMVRT
jgi:ABC-type multidrug transport system fused ATPase/permease subunit